MVISKITHYFANALNRKLRCIPFEISEDGEISNIEYGFFTVSIRIIRLVSEVDNRYISHIIRFYIDKKFFNELVIDGNFYTWQWDENTSKDVPISMDSFLQSTMEYILKTKSVKRHINIKRIKEIKNGYRQNHN